MRQQPSNPRLLARVADPVARRPWPVAAMLILLFGAMAWSAIREKSITFDEIAHVTAGYSYWIYGDYRLHPENGILPQRLAALPLLPMSLEFPGRDDPNWHASNVWNLGRTFFYEIGNDFLRMLWRARGMIVLLGMALAGVVFVWSRRLFGAGGGLLSLSLLVFCPTLLAHSALATSDVAVSLMFLAALGSFWMALHEVSVPRTLASGLALGLLLVSKMSAVVILPVLMLLFLLRVWIGRPLLVKWWGKLSTILLPNQQVATLFGSLLVQALLAIGVIWLFYGFQYTIFRNSEPGRDHMFGDYTLTSLTAEGLLGFFIRLANDWHLLPEAYLYGFAYTVHSSLVRVSFLNGEFSYVGFRSFFPIAFLAKTPLPTLAIIAAAALAPAVSLLSANGRRAAVTTRRWRRLKRGLYRTAPLWIFLVVYGTIVLRSNLNIGHRHILPMYPTIFILCGAAAYWFRSRRWIVRAALWIAVLVLAVESLGIYPHYLAYFNELAGGPRNGHRVLVDSSLDWGQDLPGLKRWIDRHAQRQPIYLSYFGVGLPENYGLATLELPAYPDWREAPETGDLRPGVYCLSATNLQHVYLLPRGPWTAEYESRYQVLRSRIGALIRSQQDEPQMISQPPSNAAAAQEAAERSELIRDFERYRFARLCAYLRLREPDDSVGYSILIYNISADDLQTALFRPLSEWPTPPYRSD